jgi:hypothetical protein
MGNLPMYNQLWVDNPRLMNFWVKNQFSQENFSLEPTEARVGKWNYLPCKEKSEKYKERKLEF